VKHKNVNFDMRTKIKMYRTLIRPTVLHGSGSRAFATSDGAQVRRIFKESFSRKFMAHLTQNRQ
jgi:hypothetical protein